MQNHFHKKPRIYADFNNWDGDENSRRLILNCKGTFDDLIQMNIELRDGFEIIFYADDLDQFGNSDDLEVEGIVRFDKKFNYWIGVVDWNAIRHASDKK